MHFTTIAFAVTTVSAHAVYGYYPTKTTTTISIEGTSISAGHYPLAPEGFRIRKPNRNAALYGMKAMKERGENEQTKPYRNRREWKHRSKCRM